jgi:hypothetical protein
MDYLKYILVATCMVAYAATLSAQSDTSGMFVKYGIWQHSFVKNGIKKDAGHNFANLALEFKDRPKSATLFNNGRKKEHQATALSLVGTSLTIIGLGVSQNQVNRATVDKNRLQWGLMAIMAGALLQVAIAVPLSHKGRNQINEAVFLYNSGQ